MVGRPVPRGSQGEVGQGEGLDGPVERPAGPSGGEKDSVNAGFKMDTFAGSD